MKFVKMVAAAGLAMACVPATAFAQDITAGATVYGPQGGEVGTIKSVDGDNVVVDTGTHTAALPANAIGEGENGLTIGFTKTQLDSAIAAANNQAAEQLNAALVVGATVRTADGVALGPVESISEDDKIVVNREAGAVTFTRDQFALDGEGLIVRLTNQQIEDALASVSTASDTSAG